MSDPIQFAQVRARGLLQLSICPVDRDISVFDRDLESGWHCEELDQIRAVDA